MNKTSLKDELSSRYSSIAGLIDIASKQLKTLPEGRLRIQQQGNSFSYYRVMNDEQGNGTKIDPADRKLIKGLAQSTYLKKVIKAAYKELNSIEYCIKHYPACKVEDVFDQLTSNRRMLVTPVKMPDDLYVKRWLNTPYKPKRISEGTPFYETQNGERVRSKSEQIIADRLKSAGIPYKYECPLMLLNGIVHPDFTILRMSDRKELYYEHLGRMDDPDYANDNTRRINNYQLSGFRLGDRLFTTMETRQNPLDIRVLNQMIENQFR